jgi:O-antigen ligase
MGGVGLLLVLRSPLFNLWASVAMTLLFVGNNNAITTGKIAAAAILILAIVRGLMAREWRASDVYNQHKAWLNPLLLFSGFIVLSSLINVALGGTAFVDFLREFVAFLNYLLLIPAIIFIDTPRKFTATLIFIGVLVIAVVFRDFGYAIFNANNINTLVPLAAVLDSTFSTPSTPLFFFGLFFLPFVFNRGLLQIALGVPLALMSAILIVLVGTRSFWVAILVGIVILVLLRRNWLWWFMLGLVAAFIILIEFNVLLEAVNSQETVSSTRTVTSQLNSFFNLADDPSVIYRLDETSTALNQFYASPFFGQGLGYQITTQQQVGSRVTVYQRGYIHDFYVYLLLKAGIVGAGLFAWFFINLMRAIWRIARNQTTPQLINSRGFAQLLFVCIVMLIFISISSSYLNDISTTVVLAPLIGILLRLAPFPSASSAALEMFPRRPIPYKTMPTRVI